MEHRAKFSQKEPTRSKDQQTHLASSPSAATWTCNVCTGASPSFLPSKNARNHSSPLSYTKSQMKLQKQKLQPSTTSKNGSEARYRTKIRQPRIPLSLSLPLNFKLLLNYKPQYPFPNQYQLATTTNTPPRV